MSQNETTGLSRRAQLAIGLGALGVVFGDIGTSPLYTMKQCRDQMPAGVDAVPGVLGVLSLMFWALVIVVCLKYLYFVSKADNKGEGGIFALLALLPGAKANSRERKLGPVVLLVLVGAALLYGDGIITPAISVLGAAEGFEAIDTNFAPFVPWTACVILAILFWFQKHGTHRIGNVFGPVMFLWFLSLALIGTWHLVQYPSVLIAVNPLYGLALLEHQPLEVASLLGAIVLTVTGAEALYADMGHFGRRYIAWAWYAVAFPGLLLNYFGQGAFLLSHPHEAGNPFFALVPQGIPRILLTLLSILAAIIASQALISGAYSLTRQAIQLGYFPRLRVLHTNAQQSGQIYLPFVNALLALGSIFTVAFFESTDRLASAYGIAVTGTMAITTVAYFLVMRKRPGFWLVAIACVVFLVADLGFFLANFHKIVDGGWFPLAIGAAVLATMHTWKVGRGEIYRRVYDRGVTDQELTSIAASAHVTRVRGAAVFMVGSAGGTPMALLHHVKSNHCLHKTVIILTIRTEEVPAVPANEQLELTELGEGLWRAIGHYGYMESPDVAALMESIRSAGVPLKEHAVTYFFNREMIVTGGGAHMWKWQKRFYSVLSRNAIPARDYYQLPPSQIVELGLPVQL